ncbi:MAG: group II truncated hemoglobin [Methylococcales bacterium]
MTEETVITPYFLLGGEAALLNLVERFYFYMDTMPAAAKVRQIHAQDLTQAKSKLFKFLSGWLGGPNLFIQEFGHPRLRQRHLRFDIGEAEVDQWLLCMDSALTELRLDPALHKEIWRALTQLARHMANQA